MLSYSAFWHVEHLLYSLRVIQAEGGLSIVKIIAALFLDECNFLYK